MRRSSIMEFERIKKLPPYILGQVTQMMIEARRRGEDIINLGMGNPDLPTPRPIVEKLKEAADKPKNHRYSVSRGILKLRLAITRWYKKKYDVDLDPDSEAIVTIGAKEGLSHLMIAITKPGDVVFVQDPAYPIHTYAPVIAGAEVRPVSLKGDFFENLRKAKQEAGGRGKILIISFPSNPTTDVVELPFFEKVIAFAEEQDLLVIHDLAYADLVFDGYRAPSILQVPGAKKRAVEIYSLSKGYSMPGWRVGFVVGNSEMIFALMRLKSYLDYGMFTPIQVAATVALDGPQGCVKEIVETYRQRRDVLCEGLWRIGWQIEKPRATMFVWGEIPGPFRKIGSVEFAKRLLSQGKVAVSPGLGFGGCGEGYVRFALVENEKRIRQAVRGIKEVLGP
ncbi:MAG: aminotransferase class I/II-fold pyridoxal phosphate-dependent enzyme [Deltaproteobacteria bacterium]|nr:aminotransferase class I/II-fold pyridoxal phosphate-dependent enzyme [Deltaproteobacteria bacterium]MBI4373863.1 aminotransferase class I/II-fold pyridoxal phosphate-dependent enzyme [Deltaproteobacteria bacterium]